MTSAQYERLTSEYTRATQNFGAAETLANELVALELGSIELSQLKEQQTRLLSTKDAYQLRDKWDREHERLKSAATNAEASYTTVKDSLRQPNAKTIMLAAQQVEDKERQLDEMNGANNLKMHHEPGE